MRAMACLFLGGCRDRHDREDRRRIILTNLVCVLAGSWLLPLGIVDFFKGAILLGVLEIFLSLLFANIFLYLRLSGNIGFSSFLAAFIYSIYCIYLFWSGGMSGTGFMWHYSQPPVATFLLGYRRGISATIALFLSGLIILGLDLWTDAVNLYAEDFALRYVPTFLFVALLVLVAEKIRESHREQGIAREKIFSDTISQLKNKKRYLGQAHEKLEKLLLSRTRELMLTNAKLKREINYRKKTERERQDLEAELLRAKKMEALGTLAGGVAHDLNNILSGLVSYPELLLLDLPEDSPLYQPLETIKKSGEKATAIVQDLLTLARRGISVKKPVYINKIIKDYFHSPEFFKLQGRFPQVTVEQHLVPVLAPISGSPVHLAKSFMNLVTNSFEAIDGTGRVIISTRATYLDKPLRGYDGVAVGNYIVLTVQDTGRGMRESEIDKIFEPFYTRKEMGDSGSGLGMTVVWGTVKDHNGYIVIDSEPGRGTTMRLYFPAAPEPEYPEKTVPAEAELPRGKGEMILVVDDVVEQREIAIRMLEKLGYNVQAVASGEDALSLVRDQRFDLMLIDMVMEPGIDGLETFRQARQLYPEQKALIVSGYSESARVREAQELGAGQYIKKPYSLDRIARALHEELAGIGNLADERGGTVDRER